MAGIIIASAVLEIESFVAELEMGTSTCSQSIPQAMLICSAAWEYVLLISWLEFLAAAAKTCIVFFRHAEQVGRVPGVRGIPSGRKYGYESAIEVVFVIALAKQ